MYSITDKAKGDLGLKEKRRSMRVKVGVEREMHKRGRVWKSHNQRERERGQKPKDCDTGPQAI